MRCASIVATVGFLCCFKYIKVDSKEFWNGEFQESFRRIEYNATIYLGYSNNPFGLSTPFPQNLQNDKYNFLSSSDSSENYLEKDSSEFRHKRGVVHLYSMVSCATGCNPLIYKGYGCFCGFLGSGHPVDGVDRCCKQHDWCYNTARCPLFLEYFVPYYWRCFHGKPICAIQHPHLGNANLCSQRLCECDRILSECLRKFPCPTSRALCKSSPIRLIQNTLMIL